MKLFQIIFFLIILVNSVYSTSFISEINFLDNEYIEIYSNTTLNLTSKKLYDDAGINKSNILQPLKLINSSTYLIVGTDFISTHNISNLNSSIYKTGKTNLGYRNLKNDGENISLLVNQNLTLLFTKTKNFNFDINQSLNYNYYKNTYYISNQTPGKIQILEKSINLLNYEFKIIPKQNIITNKLEYKFQTNATNYTITYWITDYQNNILKSKYNTTNTNTKTFTPKLNISDIIIIHAILNTKKNITKYANQSIFYYKAPQIINTTNQKNNCYINIITYEDPFYQNKLEYKFKVPNKNFTIEYWIEDYQNITIKSKRNTTNTNKKFYTPKTFSNIFQIKANYYSKNCTTNTSKLVFFYKKYEKKRCTSTTTTKKQEKNSYIRILNKEDLIGQKTNILKYEIYKGDTNKRTIYIYENSNKLHSQELPKFTKIKGQIILPLLKQKNSIKINGLDLEEIFQIKTNKTYTKELLTKSISKFQISNITQNNSNINFKTNTSLQNISGTCYINFIRTKISNIINLTKNTIKINQSKLLTKKNLQKYNLTLICKYQKQNKKTTHYESKKFIYHQITNINSNHISKLYSIKQDPTNSNINLSKSKYVILNSLNLSNYLENSIQITQIQEKEQKILNNYSSNNQILKENSFFAIFIIISIFFSLLLIKW